MTFLGLRCQAVRGGLIALAVLASASVIAQPAVCDGRLLAASQKLDFPYAARPGGYCDGTIAIDNSAALQVVSYTMGPVRFAPQQPRIRLQVVPVSSGHSIKVIGLDKRPGGSYRFDAVLPPGGIDLDLGPAVHPKGLKAEDLGFVAWTMLNGRTLYTPVVAGAPDPADVPILVLRAPTAVVQAAYEICSDAGDCGPQQAWARDLEAGSRLELKLPRGPSARQTTVKITVLAPGGRIIGDVVRLLAP